MNPIFLLLACLLMIPSAVAEPIALAIVTQDRAPMRAAPRSGAPTNAFLWQGETVEVRGERQEYLQIYDYRRERGGYVRASQVKRILPRPEEAPELLAVVRFLRSTSRSEALGIGFSAAYIEAASVEVLNSEVGVEALDALGSFAERLAQRASSVSRQDKAAQATLAGHLEVAARYGVNFTTVERNGRVLMCYDGEAFRRVLAMRSNPEQRARAALALTSSECMSDLRPSERRHVDEWRAEVLDRVEPAGLPVYLRNRILMRRASVWSSLAYQRTRKGEPEGAGAAAGRALSELGGVTKAELSDDDARTYNDAAMQVNASRWALTAPATADSKRLHFATTPAESGETCVLLLDAKNDVRRPLARRCTYGVVWVASASVNREGNALAIAVQPTDTWRELWIFRKTSSGWSVRILPPAATAPHIGYAEFAGWRPGGKQMLVAREARGDGRYRRSFEVVQLDSLATVRQAAEPGGVAAFQRWQDTSWKRETVSLR